MSRDIYIVGNWKMNQSLSDIQSFFDIANKTEIGSNCHAWVAPQFIHIPKVLELSSKVKVGGQNCSHQEKGAFTGDISPTSLKEIGASFVIIGHSERRAIFNESNSLLNEKTKLAIDTGLTVIFCVGESLEEREANQTEAVVESQIKEGLKGLSTEQFSNIIVAYEPVWAIGTGVTASPEQAEEIHKFIRTLWEKEGFPSAEKLAILYGGSVKPSNVNDLLSQQNIDGALVGGASLKGDDFKELVEAGSK